MIQPHGGKLIDRVLKGEELSYWQERLKTLPQVRLSPRQQSDLAMIACGAFSPLDGFMVRQDYEGVVQDMRLADGLAWSLPVILAVDSEQARHFREGSELALFGPEGNAVGVLQLEEVYTYDKEVEARQVYRTSDANHPGVQNLYQQGEVLLGGKISLMPSSEKSPFAPYDLKPSESRALFAQKGWKSVVGFQTRNPIHRAHEYIQKCALEIVDGLFIHPLVGETKEGDIPAPVRMRCYQVLLDGYYPKDRVVLGVMPAFMRYAGPREAIFHAIVRKNYGCTHLIVGRDHAGVGDYYGPYDAHYIFDEFKAGELGITPLFFENSFYCNLCDAMATSKTCPHPEEARLSLSGTQVRAMLAKGELPPPRFTRPEVAKILMESVNG